MGRYQCIGFLHSPHVTLVSGTNGCGKSAVMLPLLRPTVCPAHSVLPLFALALYLCNSPHVTLVSGTNGSGKSAVMQGLQLTLFIPLNTLTFY